MAETDHLKKISWFEKFTYQLIKDIDHSAFHKKREEKLRKYRSVNSALIRIFAYRLTYRNFETLKLTISQIAEEIASGEVKDILIQLEAADEKGNMQEGDNAADLIKIIIFLLREEVEKCLDEAGDIEKYLTETPLSDNTPQKKQIANKTQKVGVKEKEQHKEEKADRKWLTSSSGGSLIFKEEIPADKPKSEKKFKDELPIEKPKSKEKGQEKADRKWLTSSSGGSLIFKEEIPADKPKSEKKFKDELPIEKPKSKEKGQEKADRKWLTSSSGGSLLFKGKTLEDFSKNLSDYEKKAPAVTPEDDKVSLQAAAKKSEIKKMPNPLSDKPKPDSHTKESRSSAKPVSSPTRTVDDLLKNLGGSGLDELIYGTKKSRKKDKASGEAVDREQDDALMDWID